MRAHACSSELGNVCLRSAIPALNRIWTGLSTFNIQGTWTWSVSTEKRLMIRASHSLGGWRRHTELTIGSEEKVQSAFASFADKEYYIIIASYTLYGTTVSDGLRENRSTPSLPQLCNMSISRYYLSRMFIVVRVEPWISHDRPTAGFHLTRHFNAYRICVLCSRIVRCGPRQPAECLRVTRNYHFPILFCCSRISSYAFIFQSPLH